MKPIKFLALDIGERRIGVAAADSATKLAYPVKTLHVDGTEQSQLRKLIDDEHIDLLVIGYPRNLSGEATAQTRTVEAYAETLRTLNIDIVFQDESLTSVEAEKHLSTKRPYSRDDIDAYAAVIILTDYIESHYG